MEYCIREPHSLLCHWKKIYDVTIRFVIEVTTTFFDIILPEFAIELERVSLI